MPVRLRWICLLCVVVVGSAVGAEPETTSDSEAPDLVGRDKQGRLIPAQAPAPAELNNPWPAEWQEGFAERADHALKYWSRQRLSFNTWGENEKSGYPHMMWAYLLGRKDQALKAFHASDYQKQDHAHTLGVDLYWCFTLKGQMRKFFHFGPALSEEYKARFLKAGKIWTEKDPYGRPHPVHGKGGKGGGWGPNAKGSWVDVRRTDNLRAMTDTSVYLMAEATGNEATRKLYKQRILAYVRMLYNMGMMEWDSCNYHGHTLAPYHNLYDFAKDPEVRKLAKAALDWLYSAGALKYWRGGFGGPNNRDYGNSNVVFGGGAVQPLWLYFDDAVIDNPTGHYDDVHHITSSYRPPMAVVHLARKSFPRPVEILSTKPYYRMWEPGQEHTPQYWETLYWGRTFSLGSAVSREPMKPWTPCVFKMMAHNSRRGVDYFVVNTSQLAGHKSFKNAGDQIAQYRDLLVWLKPVSAPDKTFHFQIPRSADVEDVKGVRFVQMEKTWLAIRPISLGPWKEWKIPQFRDKKDRRTGKPLPNPAAETYKDEAYFTATATGEDYAGFALEVGEEKEFPSYAAFKQAVLSRGKLDLRHLGRGDVTLTGTDAATLRIQHNSANDLPAVHRDGVKFDYAKHLDVYKPVTGDAPIVNEWMSGKLTVTAGGWQFTSQVTEDGKVTWDRRRLGAGPERAKSRTDR